MTPEALISYSQHDGHLGNLILEGAKVTSFVIWTEDEEDLGFLGFARHDGEWPPAGENECVFSGFPHDPSLLDDPRGRFVMEHKGREWIADVNYTDTEMTVRINLDTGWAFELWSNDKGNNWKAVREDVTLTGTGMFL
ncbi:hypothetical protein G6N74_30250 [Mesorhizobium sp. CGMCC 1.15528]|uniref:Uncharacterized protein n=1 Tax=Mesorhizobium zhangyense TaxID=1776730 RepID=A0A7C9VH38_9HYPH|nr:hypothetical protein [Mesorhizobium zhangyense]NGN45329.1 hypothetical protein [Mesorhizobium zhangyense]